MYLNLDQPLHLIPFVLFDLESTGLDVQVGHRICEIAMLRVEARKTTARFEQLVNPQRDIDPAAYAVNGIAQAMVDNAPTFAQVLPGLMPLTEGAVLVAHNAYFDVGFLSTELTLLGQPPLPNPVIDTLALARRYISARRYNLTALATSLGERAPTHRAMSDVIALRAVFDHLLDLLYRRGVHTLNDLLRAQRGLLPGDEESRIAQHLSAAMTAGESLVITYRTGGGEAVERRVLPMGITIEGRRQLLHAFCYLRNAPRSFSLDRLSIVHNTVA
jgi:DNA polymerase III subunit epsilon